MKLRVLLISIAACCIVLAVYSAVKENNTAYNETKKAILLRKLAHELMLSSGDSTSRVLPVKQISPEEFHVFPATALAIVPDSFVNIVNRAIEKGQLTGSLTAGIIKYQQNETVYGFAASPFEKDKVVSCIGRELPKDRYYLRFVFASQNGFNNYAVWCCIGGALLVLAGIFYTRKIKKQPVSNPIIQNTAPDANTDGLINIGNYIFNPAKQSLQLNEQVTPLTVKETKLLNIVAASPNVMVERETLQKEVWENEGVIVTRSLDMFISKLRKKLAGDPAIKIVNVHGKGYRLEITT